MARFAASEIFARPYELIFHALVNAMTEHRLRVERADVQKGTIWSHRPFSTWPFMDRYDVEAWVERVKGETKVIVAADSGPGFGFGLRVIRQMVRYLFHALEEQFPHTDYVEEPEGYAVLGQRVTRLSAGRAAWGLALSLGVFPALLIPQALSLSFWPAVVMALFSLTTWWGLVLAVRVYWERQY